MLTVLLIKTLLQNDDLRLISSIMLNISMSMRKVYIIILNQAERSWHLK